jgi:hypothetical protein
MDTTDSAQPNDELNQFRVVSPGWILLNRSEAPDETVLCLARRDRPHKVWVTASGPTFEEALSVGMQRVAIFDEIDREWRERVGSS